MLPLGTTAPGFQLPDTTGSLVSRVDFVDQGVQARARQRQGHRVGVRGAYRVVQGHEAKRHLRDGLRGHVPEQREVGDQRVLRFCISAAGSMALAAGDDAAGALAVSADTPDSVRGVSPSVVRIGTAGRVRVRSTRI
jgi:hypothetical protein